MSTNEVLDDLKKPTGGSEVTVCDLATAEGGIELSVGADYLRSQPSDPGICVGGGGLMGEEVELINQRSGSHYGRRFEKG